MYSHTRSRSIAKKCHGLGVDLSRVNDIDTSNIPDSMYELLRIIACHNDVLAGLSNRIDLTYSLVNY